MDIPILPLAVTMMAGPQEMSALIFVAHPDARRVSTAFLAGATAAVILGTTIAYLLADTLGDLGPPSDRGSAGKIIQYALVALLVALALRTYRNREHVEPPAWLGRLFKAGAAKAMGIGFLLVFAFPTDVATMLTVGVHLQQGGHSLIEAAPFWALTILIAALPFLALLLFRRWAEVAIPRLRDWMTANAWLVNIFVLGIFILLILS